MRLTQWAHLFIFAVIGLVSVFQARRILTSSSGGASSAGSVAPLVQARLDKAYEEVRQATLTLLAVDQTVTNRRVALSKTRHALTSLSRSRRAARRTREANHLFDQCMSQIGDLQEAIQQKQAVMENYVQRRNALDRVLEQNHSLKSTSGLLPMGFTGILLLSGAALVLWTHRRMENRLVRSLRELLQCVEAAASGDLSRPPAPWSRDEIGQLAQAIGRLISVLTRSENLVYHLAALVESSGEAIISHTLDGTILSWNKGAQRIYGYSAEEVKGRSIAILSPQDGESELVRNLERIRRGERIQPFETIHQTRQGRRLRALVRTAAILDSTCQVIGASFCAVDLTGREAIQPKAIEGTQAA